MGISAVNQTVYSSQNQLYSPGDLNIFQNTFGIPNHPVDHDVNNRATTTCTYSICGESNLDLQYIMAIAQNTTTNLVYVKLAYLLLKSFVNPTMFPYAQVWWLFDELVYNRL